MKTEQQVREQLAELRERDKRARPPNMGYELGGAIDALEWVLNEIQVLTAGLR